MSRMNGTTEIIQKLKNSFYMDNCVRSLPEYNALNLFIEQATKVFEGVKFKLRGWEYTYPELEGPANTAIFGTSWDKKEDTLVVDKVSLEMV